ncbi:MAG: hypothetical protein FJ146_09480 [Deltaproteobacteria bacterium]|nr:hypothetical protein [Deltaproteobacteria bacterium]
MKTKHPTNHLLILVFVLGLFGTTRGTAQSDGPAPAEGTATSDKKAKDKAADDVESDFPPVPDTPGVRKKFSKDEVNRICAQVEGRIIAFYDDIYKVEHCQRRPLRDNKTVYNMQRGGTRVQDVDSDVVAALPEGEPLDEATSLKNARGCGKLEGHYITYSNVDVYFVEKCKKRIFPDWMTYIEHREHRQDKKGEILALSAIEFENIATGKPIGSVVDALFAKMLSGEAGVEVIPIDEACAGLEGRIASYYSYVYRVEKCRKREIKNSELYLKKLGVDNVLVYEMSSEQWLSLPNGAPITAKPDVEPQAPLEFKPKWRQR